MKILIGIPTAEMARRADFYDYFNMLDKPDGTICSFSHGQSPARGRNLIIEQALEHNCTHIFFLDDDVAFKPDTLMRLMSHDVDMVTGLYLFRNYPHQPIIFDYSDEEGKCRHINLENQTGLIEIVNAGLGCCLINTKVFRAIEKPYIRLGQLEKDGWCDDIDFFNRARAVGFKLYCDFNIPIGHFASITVWPSMVNGKWHTVYDSFGKGQVSFPQLKFNVQVPSESNTEKNDGSTNKELELSR